MKHFLILFTLVSFLSCLPPAKPTPKDAPFSDQVGWGLSRSDYSLPQLLGIERFTNTMDIDGDYWYLDMIHSPEAWNYGAKGKGIIVAVVDTGVDYNHPFLKDNIVGGYDFVDDDTLAMDENDHGTHCAGIILKNAPDVYIMPIRVLDAGGNGSYEMIIAGIKYAIEQGVKVINVSLGGSVGSSEMEKVLTLAQERGVLVVMAAGNAGGSYPIYPAHYASKGFGIAVGAVDMVEDITEWSNKAGDLSPYPYVTAPGDMIFSTIINNSWAYMSGTSMAAPQVVGSAALLYSQKKEATLSEIKKALTTTK